ncbi:MAG: hypothetical protein M2R45_05438 [Verrucomicrobia subdivision 3 bacterium]|nr:hypothetical protein [Limisphaerales bacterium]MCS1417308.1 hypothetical protein [Limisphaerales bacterium]
MSLGTSRLRISVEYSKYDEARGSVRGDTGPWSTAQPSSENHSRVACLTVASLMLSSCCGTERRLIAYLGVNIVGFQDSLYSLIHRSASSSV